MVVWMAKTIKSIKLRSRDRINRRHRGILKRGEMNNERNETYVQNSE